MLCLMNCTGAKNVEIPDFSKVVLYGEKTI